MSKKISDKIKTQVAKEIFFLKEKRPNLAIIVVGKKHIYLKNIKNLEKEAVSVGVDTNLYIYDSASTEMELEAVIELLNNDEMIDAIYIQTPLPDNFNLDNILSKVKAKKDISFEEDFENVDWKILEANIFKSVLEVYKEKDK